MDPNQQWNWPPPPQGRYPPPMPNGMNPFGTQFGMPFNSNPGWNQPAPQAAAPFATQPAGQDNARGRGQEGYQVPSQKRRRHRRRPSPSGQPRPRRAPAPSWNFSGETGQGQGQGQEQRQFFPSPMDSAPPGPFASTRPSYRDASPRNNYPGDHKAANKGPIWPPNQANQANQASGGSIFYTNTPNSNSNPNPNRNRKQNQNFRHTARRPSPPPTATPGPPPRGPPKDRDPITAPSAASGGVPEPTTAYLMRSSFLPLASPSARPILVVIDLNGTLLHRPNKRAASKFIERPGARAFLKSCIDKHHVILWSSARPENVERMCSQLLPPAYLSRVIAIWGRDRFGLTREDYARRTQCYKRLTRLWDDPIVAASHPQAQAQVQAQAQQQQGGGGEAGAGACWNQGNTVLIDDSVEKARSEPHNAITLPEFAGDVKEQPEVLAMVSEYLDKLAWQMDISTYIRAQPFKLGA